MNGSAKVSINIVRHNRGYSALPIIEVGRCNCSVFTRIFGRKYDLAVMQRLIIIEHKFGR